MPKEVDYYFAWVTFFFLVLFCIEQLARSFAQYTEYCFNFFWFMAPPAFNLPLTPCVHHPGFTPHPRPRCCGRFMELLANVSMVLSLGPILQPGPYGLGNPEGPYRCVGAFDLSKVGRLPNLPSATPCSVPNH